jgi:hypothetical protein
MSPNFADPCDPIWANLKSAVDVLIGLSALVTALFGFLADRYERTVKSGDISKPNTILPFGRTSIAVLGSVAVLNFASIFVGHSIEKRISVCSSITQGRQIAQLQKEVEDKTAQLDHSFVQHLTDLAQKPIDEISTKLSKTERQLDASVTRSSSRIRQIVGRESIEEPSNAIALGSYTIILRVPARLFPFQKHHISPLLNALLENERRYCESTNADDRTLCPDARRDLLRVEHSSGWLDLVDPEGNRKIVVTVEMEEETVSFTKEWDCREFSGCLGSGSDEHDGADPSWNDIIGADSYWREQIASNAAGFTSILTDLLIDIPKADGLHGRDTNLKGVAINVCSFSTVAPKVTTDLSHLELIVSVRPKENRDADLDFVQKVYPITSSAARVFHPDKGDQSTTCVSMSYTPSF